MVLKQRKILHFTPSVLLIVALLIFVSSNSDTVSHYTNFVYKICRNQTHVPKNLVSSLLQELVEKSSESKFYQTTTNDDTVAVSGVFQFYQSSVSTTFVQKDYLQHKKCGQRRARFTGLEEVLNDVFEAIIGCIVSNRDGHCVTMLEGIYAMGQCEGSLGRCECGKCVDNTFQVARDECWGFGSGEVYLENCFVSFSDNEGDRNSSRENDIGGGSAKLVAIVVGVGVALGLLSAVCYCIRSSTRKRDDW